MRLRLRRDTSRITTNTSKLVRLLNPPNLSRHLSFANVTRPNHYLIISIHYSNTLIYTSTWARKGLPIIHFWKKIWMTSVSFKVSPLCGLSFAGVYDLEPLVGVFFSLFRSKWQPMPHPTAGDPTAWQPLFHLLCRLGFHRAPMKKLILKGTVYNWIKSEGAAEHADTTSIILFNLIRCCPASSSINTFNLGIRWNDEKSGNCVSHELGAVVHAKSGTWKSRFLRRQYVELTLLKVFLQCKDNYD